MKETMTIHKALTELKTLDSRISGEIGQQQFVCANKHSNAKIGGEPVADYVSAVRDGYKSVCTLINRRNAIKRAVTRSNAATMVIISGKEYSVAEAIDMKAKGCEYLRTLYDVLTAQLNRAKRKADENNEMVNARADEYIRSIYAGADLKNMGDEIQKAKDAFIAAQTVEIVDPISAASEASKIKDEIDSFLSEVDAALSVSNALTTVEVEYETK